MLTLIHVLDAAALWITWWCAAAAVVAGQEVRNWRNLAVSAGLIGVMVFAFCGALAMTFQPPRGTWWGFGLRAAVAIVAMGLYEYRFGIGRHLRMLRAWALDCLRHGPHWARRRSGPA
ncbi:MAG: hypothetical protein ACREPV_01235 [Lysobacter sp.]